MTYNDTFRYVAPDPSKYWQFDGVDSHLTTDEDLWDETADFTISCQVYGLNGTEAAIWGSGSSSTAHALIVTNTGFRVVFGGFVDGVTSWEGGSWGSTLSGTTWYELALTYEASTETLRVYLDGTLIDTQVLSAPTHSSGQQLGAIGQRSSSGGVEPFSGRMRRIFQYNSLLSGVQIASLHDGEAVGSPLIEYDIQNINSSSTATNIGTGSDGTFSGVTDATFFASTTDAIPNAHPPATLYCKPLPLDADPWGGDDVALVANGRTGSYDVSGLTDNITYEIFVQAGSSPASTDTPVGATDPFGAILASILAKTSLIGTGTAMVTAPVSADGDLLELIIGDDYLVANGRALEWEFDAIPGITQAGTVKFGVKNSADVTETYINTTGTIEEITEELFKAIIEIPKTALTDLTPGNYNWSVEVAEGAVEITIARNRQNKTRVAIVEKQT